MFYATGALISP